MRIYQITFIRHSIQLTISDPQQCLIILIYPGFFFAIFDCCDSLEMAHLFNEISEIINNTVFFYVYGFIKTLNAEYS